MITKEQVRARYFACYIGSKTIHTDPRGFMEEFTSWGLFGDYIITKFGTVYGHWEINRCQLLLRPLSAITDEDAIEVAKIYYYNPLLHNTTEANVLIEAFNQHPDTITFDVADYLRSRGYYTGSFMGYDPIAEGWAIVDDKNVL